MRLHERMAAIMASRLDMSARAILFVLATYLDSDDEERAAWPSTETIGQQAGCSRQTVGAILARLESLGVVVVVQRAGLGRSTRRMIDWHGLALATSERRAQPSSRRTADRPVIGRADVQSLDARASDGWTAVRPMVGHDPSIVTNPENAHRIRPGDPPIARAPDLAAQLAALESASTLPTAPTEPEQAQGCLPVASTAGEGGGRLTPETPTGGIHGSPVHGQQASRTANHQTPAAQAPHEIVAAQNRTPGAADPRAADPRGQAPAGQGGGPPGVGVARHQPGGVRHDPTPPRPPDGRCDARDPAADARPGDVDPHPGGGVDAPSDPPVAPPGPDPVGAADSPLGAEAGLFGPGAVRAPDRPVEPPARVRGRRANAAAPAGRAVVPPAPARVDHLADGSAWGRAAAAWQVIAGRAVAMQPGAGLGAQLARAVEVDADRVVYRLERVADARLGRREAGNAGRDALRTLDELQHGLVMLLRGLGVGPGNAACAGLDQQRLDDAAGIARNGPPRASGGRVGSAHGLSVRERQEADRRATMEALDRIARGGEDVIDAQSDVLLLGGA